MINKQPNMGTQQGSTVSLRKTLVLKGLSCANCAAKIEEEVNDLSEVKSAFVDFALGRITFEVYKPDSVSVVVDAVARVVARHEPDVEVIDKLEPNSKGNFIDGQTIKLVSAAVLFAIALVFNLPFWAELSCYLVSYLLVGGEILGKAVRNIRYGQVFDENFLMSVATLGALAIQEYPEAVAVMLFFRIGEYFQDMAVNRSRRSIAELMDIRPDYANLKVGNRIQTVSPESVQIGSVIVVKPGERVPLDGKVLTGESTVDTSALTGESMPRRVTQADPVLSGFVNKTGVLTIEVEKEFGQSTVSKILDLVQNAASKKAPTENFITKFARYYTPVVVFAALALAIIPPLVIGEASFSQWLYRALVFLIISCPCALVVSIPLTFFGGIGGASRSGVLVKGSNYLEALNDVDTVVFDKTGTLTRGIFQVTDCRVVGNTSKEELLKFAAYAESFSNHPIALSIIQAYGKSINNESIIDYEEVPGNGVRAVIEGKKVLVGSAKFLDNEGINCVRSDQGTVVHVAVNRSYLGSLTIADQIKPDSFGAIRDLKKLGVRKAVMLTGDNESVGAAIGQQLELDAVFAQLLPDQKVEHLELLEQHKQGKLLFVGDGINDAPVLARADVGIAMGGLGSDAAIEAADVVLMTDEPSKLVTAIKIAKRTHRIVWQNIILSLGVKGIFLILGAFGLASLWEAVFADVGVTVVAVLNAMRALRVTE